jgi:phosphate starvation-inducible protein PhoH
MSERKRWDALAKALERFHEVEKVKIVAFGEYQDVVRVYVVVSRNENDEELRSKLAKVEESIMKEFSEFTFDFCYI